MRRLNLEGNGASVDSDHRSSSVTAPTCRWRRETSDRGEALPDSAAPLTSQKNIFRSQANRDHLRKLPKTSYGLAFRGCSRPCNIGVHSRRPVLRWTSAVTLPKRLRKIVGVVESAIARNLFDVRPAVDEQTCGPAHALIKNVFRRRDALRSAKHAREVGAAHACIVGKSLHVERPVQVISDIGDHTPNLPARRLCALVATEHIVVKLHRSLVGECGGLARARSFAVT